MRKILLPLLAAGFLFACNTNDTTAVKGATDSTAKTEPLDLPYKVERTPDWEIGNPAHVATAMKTLKAYVDNDTVGIKQYLTDTVEFYADNMKFRGTRDSLVRYFSSSRAQYDSIEIKMQDYESVKSKSRGDEWVGMWYVEIDKHKGGAIDSAMVMDDIKIVNGKVAIIDTKARRLAKQ